MRLLVVGASGLVGGALVRAARARALHVTGAARSVLGEATRVVDLADRAGVARLVSEAKPDAVAICSAWPHVDGCEADPARSERENVGTVRTVLDVLGSAGARVLFYSTDHVFDGAREAPYVESDPVRPLSVYARHKRDVEELLVERGGALIVRTAWVFGAEIRRKNFGYRVADAAKSGEALRLPVSQSGAPTFAPWLADATLDLLDRGLEGIAHVAGAEPLTKAEWARLLARELGLPPLRIEEVSWAEAGQIAPRPARVALASERHRLVQPDLRTIVRENAQAFV